MGASSVTGTGQGSASDILNPVSGLGPAGKIITTTNQVLAEIVGENFVVDFTALGVNTSPIGTSVLLYQPGGEQIANVFNNWANLYTAITRVKGMVTVQVDSTYGVPTVPAGTYDLTNVTLYGAINPAYTELHFLPGAILTGLGQVQGNLNLFSDSNTPVLQYKNTTQFVTFSMLPSATSTNPTGPLIQLDNSNLTIIMLNGVNFFNFGGQVINMKNGSILTIIVNGFCVIGNNIFSGDGSITINKFDTSSTVSTVQPAFTGTIVVH